MIGDVMCTVSPLHASHVNIHGIYTCVQKTSGLVNIELSQLSFLVIHLLFDAALHCTAVQVSSGKVQCRKWHVLTTAYFTWVIGLL